MNVGGGAGVWMLLRIYSRQQGKLRRDGGLLERTGMGREPTAQRVATAKVPN